ncbi:hypothetical protein [Flavobacterium beibuense]|uniref:hypothetical protein n=1 Tax=Flavobacterium beibuense TaxID=657326 RepID=UPI003A9191C3
MTQEEIKSKMQYGDYATLGKILKVTVDAARKRFNRGDNEALDAMQKIIEAREELIQNLKTGEND